MRELKTMAANNRRVLVTGGGAFLGDAITAALLAEGAEVTLLVRPGGEDKLGLLAQRARIQIADVFDPASLRGRGRGHGIAIHTVGSLIADPSQGLTYQRLNLVSARNVATMCVSDGVPHMVLMSSVRAPWISGQYLKAKREAEDYLTRVGVNGTVIRAPIAYIRGSKRPIFFEFFTALGSIPPLSWTRLGRIAPMPIDILARGVARAALNPQKSIYYARDLRRLNRKGEKSIALSGVPSAEDGSPRQVHPFELLDDDSPNGWTTDSD
jgi:uncharacterized protein YbjT (DUF2867 family)